jgi:heat shock protein HslJ
MDGLATVPARFPLSSPLARGLWGRVFTVTSATPGQDGEEPPLVRPFRVRVSFSTERDHHVSWQARCNSYGGDTQITDTRIELDLVASTLIGCEAEAGEEDQWLLRFMGTGLVWSFEGDRLRLISDGTTIELKGSMSPG